VNLAVAGAKPQLFAAGADQNIFFDSTRTKLIYAVRTGGADDGVYAVTLP
jgi:hypothetical protein